MAVDCCFPVCVLGDLLVIILEVLELFVVNKGDVTFINTFVSTK